MRSDRAAEQRAMKDCDALFGKIMHATLPPVCALGGDCDGPLEMAHIIPRADWRLRCEAENVRMLCKKHHMQFDGNRRDWVELVGRAHMILLRTISSRGMKRPHDWWREEKKRLRNEFNGVQAPSSHPGVLASTGGQATPVEAVEPGQVSPSPVPAPAKQEEDA